MTDRPTRDELMKVRRYECTMRGHSWQVLESLGHGPQMIVCTNCGASLRVEGYHAPAVVEPEPSWLEDESPFSRSGRLRRFVARVRARVAPGSRAD